jgi:hypothetical protein
MQNFINKIYAGVLAILLAIISFFLIATYNKINDTNVMVYKLQIELAQIREKESHFMNYMQVCQIVDKKIEQYHKELKK